MLMRRDRALTALDIALDVAFHAGRGNDVTGAADIADRLGAARRGIEPLLQALVRAGLLDSVRGPRGGYRMALAPRQIKLSDIVNAVTEEDEATDPPGKLSAAVTQPLWNDLDEHVGKRMQSITLQDLLKRAAAAGLRPPAGEPLNFVI